jgi:hypothetical protein
MLYKSEDVTFMFISSLFSWDLSVSDFQLVMLELRLH